MSDQAMAIKYPASARTTSATVTSVRIKSMDMASLRAFGEDRRRGIELRNDPAGRTEHLARDGDRGIQCRDVLRIASYSGSRRECFPRVPLDGPRGAPRPMQQVDGERYEDHQRENQSDPPDHVDGVRHDGVGHRTSCRDTFVMTPASVSSIVLSPSRTDVSVPLSFVTCGAMNPVCTSMARTPNRIFERKLALAP